MLEPHFISIFFLIYCKSDSEKSLSPKEYSRISCLILNLKCMYAIKSFVWTAERCFFLAKRCFQGKPVHQRVFWPISVYQGKSMFFTLLTSTKGSQRNSFSASIFPIECFGDITKSVVRRTKKPHSTVHPIGLYLRSKDIFRSTQAHSSQ